MFKRFHQRFCQSIFSAQMLLWGRVTESVVTIITSHSDIPHVVIRAAPVSRQVSAETGDVPVELIMAPDCFLTSSSHWVSVAGESNTKHAGQLHNQPHQASRPHRLIACLFVFVCFNKSDTMSGNVISLEISLRVSNIRIHQRGPGGPGSEQQEWPDLLNVNTHSGIKVTKFGKQSQECSEEIPGLAWVPIIQIRIDWQQWGVSWILTMLLTMNGLPASLHTDWVYKHTNQVREVTSRSLSP